MATESKVEFIDESELNAESEEIVSIQNNRTIIEELCKPFSLTDEDLRNVKLSLLYEIKRGLCKFTHKNANVKCHPTYIQYLPTGCERGNFLVMEIFDEICRITQINIDEDSNINMHQESYEISDQVSLTGNDLFTYIAECLATFITNRELQEEKLNLSLIFSFPIKQVSLYSAYLIQWTNKFTCDDVIDEDIVALLHNAIQRRNDISINAIVLCNDISSSLISCAWLNKNTKISFFIGDTTNASYMEKIKHITRVQPSSRMPPIMIINTEWSSFGENGVLKFIRNTFDEQLDTNSPNPGAKLYEKMLCGVYLGELVRLIIVTAIEAGALFEGKLSDQINTPYIFTMDYIMEIDNEEPENYTQLEQILEFLGYKDKFTQDDCNNVRYICEQVSTRSSDLLATGIACLIDRIGDPYIGIAVDGFIYRTPGLYQKRLRKKLRQLARPEYEFHLLLSESGTIYGAALIAAAVAAKQK